MSDPSEQRTCVICDLPVEEPDRRALATAAREGAVVPQVRFYFVHSDCLRKVVHPDVLRNEEPI